MDNDNIMESGLSRRQMLIGSGILAAGYTVGQLANGKSTAHAADRLAIPGDFPWVGTGWTDQQIEDFAQTAGVNAYKGYKMGGSPG